MRLNVARCHAQRKDGASVIVISEDTLPREIGSSVSSRIHLSLGATLYLQELMTTVRTTMTVKTAFGEPLERDGITLIPVALVSGGGGAGGGEDEKGASGDGGGYGMCAQPVGMYVISNGRVRFRPVVNVNQLISSLGKAVAVAMFARARVVRARNKQRARDTH